MTVHAVTRLKKRSEFLAITKAGEKWAAEGLVLQAMLSSEAGESRRVGFTVSKKVDKRAVVRNRIRRRLKAVADEILPIYAQAGYDYVLIGRKQTRELPFSELKRNLRWSLKRLGLVLPQEEEGKDAG